MVVFILLHKTLFSKRFELNQLWIQTKSELTNSNYPRTHLTKLQSAFKQSMDIWRPQSSSSKKVVEEEDTIVAFVSQVNIVTNVSK